MYIRRSTRKYKGKIYTNYLLVESVHTPKGPRQRTICSLGNLAPAPAQEWRDLARRLESALKGQLPLEPSDEKFETLVETVRRGRKKRTASIPAPSAIIRVDTDHVETEEARSAGAVHVGHRIWERLGLNEILKEAGLVEQACVLSEVMTLNRLIAPSSELAMPDWVRRTAIGDILGVDFSKLDENKLYRNLDALHPNRELIERELAKRESTLFNLDDTFYLYDLTSTYFEGQAKANPQAQLGYSRDSRFDCKQVIVGLVLDRNEFPKAHEVFDGNKQDLEKLKQRVKKGHLKHGDKIHQAIGRLKERYPRVARYYSIEYDAGGKGVSWQEDSEKKAVAKKLDGSYVLKTDRQDLTADEIWRTYILLTRVEDAFRDMKSPLMERPIFHHLEHRTQTHIFLCVLAYHLLAVIEQYFLDQGIHTSWATLRDELSTHQVVTVVLPTESGGVLRIRKSTTPEATHRLIYETLRTPMEVMVPVKNWTPAP